MTVAVWSASAAADGFLFKCDGSITVTEPDQGERVSGVKTIEWSKSGDASDHNVDIHYRQGNGDWNVIAKDVGGSSWDWSTVTIPDGDGYQIRVRTTDAGVYFCEYAGESDRFIIDNSLDCVEVSVTTPTWLTHHRDTVTIQWKAWGDCSISPEYEVWWRQDSGSWTTIEGDVGSLTKELTSTSVDWDTTQRSDGDGYQIKVKAKDGVDTDTDRSGRFTIDNTDPSGYAISTPANGDVVGGVYDLNWSGTDANKFQVAVDKSVDGGSTWSHVGDADDDGHVQIETTDEDTDQARLRIQPTDAAGNVGPLVATENFTIDNTKPVVNVTDPTDGIVSGDVSITWDVTDDHRDVVAIRALGSEDHVVVDSTSDDGAYTWDSTQVEDGDYQIEVNASDEAGNNGTDLGETFTVDNVPPDPKMTSPASGDVVGGSDVELTWDLSATDIDTIDLRYSTDGGGSWNTLATDVADDGDYIWNAKDVAETDKAVVEIDAVDIGGATGTDTTPTFTLDNTAPTVDVTAPGEGDVVDATSTAEWSTIDDHVDVADLDVSCDGGATWTTVVTGTTDDGAHGWDTTPFADGTCQLRVVAVDQAGNRGQATSPTFVVDNEAPELAVRGPVDGASLSVDYVTTIDGTIEDPGVDLDEARVQLRMSPTGPYWDAQDQRWQTSQAWTTVEEGYWSVPVDPAKLTVPSSYEIVVEATNAQDRTSTLTTSFDVEPAEDALCLDCQTSDPPTVDLAAPTVRVDESVQVDLAWTIEDDGKIQETRLLHRSPDGNWKPIVVFPDRATSYTWTPDATVEGTQQVRVEVVDAHRQRDQAISNSFYLTNGDDDRDHDTVCTDGIYHGRVPYPAYEDGKVSVEADCLGIDLGFEVDLDPGEDEPVIGGSRPVSGSIPDTPDLDIWIRRGPGEGECRGEVPYNGETHLSLEIEVGIAAQESSTQLDLPNENIQSTNLTATVDPPSLPSMLTLGSPEYWIGHCEDGGAWTRVTGQVGEASGPGPTGDHVQVTGGFDGFSRYVVGSSQSGSDDADDEPPTAAFDATCDALDCTFDAAASRDDGQITAYDWTLGDGTGDAGASAEHTYADAGRYTVTLTVTDDAGAQDETTQTIDVVPPTNRGPTARLTVDCVELTCTVNGTESSDPDGEVVAYEWRFGDGTTAEGATAEHGFEREGTRTVTLVVVDDAGASGSTATPVTVGTAPTEPAPDDGGDEAGAADDGSGGDEPGPGDDAGAGDDADPLIDDDATPRTDPADRLQLGAFLVVAAAALLLALGAVAVRGVRSHQRSRRRGPADSGGIVVPRQRGRRPDGGTDPSLRDGK